MVIRFGWQNGQVATLNVAISNSHCIGSHIFRRGTVSLESYFSFTSLPFVKVKFVWCVSLILSIILISTLVMSELCTYISWSECLISLFVKVFYYSKSYHQTEFSNSYSLLPSVLSSNSFVYYMKTCLRRSNHIKNFMEISISTDSLITYSRQR